MGPAFIAGFRLSWMTAGSHECKPSFQCLFWLCDYDCESVTLVYTSAFYCEQYLAALQWDSYAVRRVSAASTWDSAGEKTHFRRDKSWERNQYECSAEALATFPFFDLPHLPPVLVSLAAPLNEYSPPPPPPPFFFFFFFFFSLAGPLAGHVVVCL